MDEKCERVVSCASARDKCNGSLFNRYRRENEKCADVVEFKAERATIDLSTPTIASYSLENNEPRHPAANDVYRIRKDVPRSSNGWSKGGKVGNVCIAPLFSDLCVAHGLRYVWQ